MQHSERPPIIVQYTAQLPRRIGSSRIQPHIRGIVLPKRTAGTIAGGLKIAKQRCEGATGVNPHTSQPREDM